MSLKTNATRIIKRSFWQTQIVVRAHVSNIEMSLSLSAMVIVMTFYTCLTVTFVLSHGMPVYAALQGGSIMKGWTNDEKMMIAYCNGALTF